MTEWRVAKWREKPLVQAVEFFEKADPMGCRFIFPKSDFDPSNSIGSRNLSVLTSTLIGLIAVNLFSRAHYGDNRNAAEFFERRESSVF